MSTKGMTDIKVFLKEENNTQLKIRRFEIENYFLNNFEYLRNKIKSLFPELKSKDFKIVWNDSEDEITLSSDEELSLALSSMTGDLKKFCIQTITPATKNVNVNVLIVDPKERTGYCKVCKKFTSLRHQLCQECRPAEKPKNMKIVVPRPRDKPFNIVIPIAKGLIKNENENEYLPEIVQRSNENEVILEVTPRKISELKQEIPNTSKAPESQTIVKMDVQPKFVDELANLVDKINVLIENNLLKLSCELVSDGGKKGDKTPNKNIESVENSMEKLKNVLDHLTNLHSNIKAINTKDNLENEPAVESLSQINKDAESVISNTESRSEFTLESNVNNEEYDQCSSVKTLSESSENIEERWTLLDHDEKEKCALTVDTPKSSLELVESCTSGIDTASTCSHGSKVSSVYKPDVPEICDLMVSDEYESKTLEARDIQVPEVCETPVPVSDVSNTQETNIYPEIAQCDNFCHPLSDLESNNSNTDARMNVTGMNLHDDQRTQNDSIGNNLSQRAIFPHIAEGLKILSEMGFNVDVDGRILCLLELHDGNVDKVLDILLC